ncbi:hypothetical protein CK203_018594 [Vitis vinifera]|uniref:Uncharacterized protein n=1 Tax=Vitis vinifera TaxID=29760 RepID=A0A438J639_VITVI|nr:hypothetical protein CK203_018594 [Vitis vinifera]
METETPAVPVVVPDEGGSLVDDAACISVGSFSYAELEEKLKQIPSGSTVVMPSARMFEVVETLVSGLRGMTQQHDLFTDLLRTSDYMKAFASQRKNSENQLRLRLEEAEASLSTARGDSEALRADLAEARSREETMDARLHEEDEVALEGGGEATPDGEREELEADYQKQVDDMFFFGYRCCMKKHGIKRDVPSIPPGPAYHFEASGSYFAIVMSGCPLNDCVHIVCEGEGVFPVGRPGCGSIGPQNADNSSTHFPLAYSSLFFKAVISVLLWLLLARYFEDNAVWSMNSGVQLNRNSDVQFRTEIPNAMLSNCGPLSVIMVCEFQNADAVFPYELGPVKDRLYKCPPIRVNKQLVPGPCVLVWVLRAECLSGGNNMASLMGREAAMPARASARIVPCAHLWLCIPSGRVLLRVANRYKPGAWRRIEPKRGRSPTPDLDDREAPSTRKVHHSFSLDSWCWLGFRRIFQHEVSHYLAFHGQSGLEFDSKLAQFDSPLQHSSG